MEEPTDEMSRRSVLQKGAIATSVLAIGGTAATGTAAAGIGDGRVGHYNLNNLHMNKTTGEKIKNFVHDASPEKNHGTARSKDTNTDGPSVIKAGAVGNAYAFERYDSSSYDYVEVSDDSSLQLTDELTLAAWVNTENAGWYPRVISREQAGQGNRQFNLGFDESGEYPRSILDVNTDGSNAIDIQGNTNVADGTWHHIAMTYEKGDAARLYVNGNQEDSQPTDQSLVSVDANIVLGAPSQLGSAAAYQGAVDEARIYNRALTDQEIGDLVAMRDS